MRNKASMANIRPYTRQFYRENRVRFAVALTSTILVALGNLLISWLLQQVIDLVAGYDIRFTLQELAGITLLAIAGIALIFLINYSSKPRFRAKGMAQYQTYLFAELTKKKISAFYGENSSLYLSALTNDLASIEKGYLTNTFDLVQSVLTFFGALFLMLWYSPLLTLIAICLALLPVLASLLTGGKLASAEKTVSDRNQSYTAALKDSLGGFSVIKSFKAEAQMCRVFAGQVWALSDAKCRKDKLSVIIQMFGSIAGIAAQMGVFLLGAWLALSGKGVTGGTVLVFLQLMNYVIDPIRSVPTCLAERKGAKALIEKATQALNQNMQEDGQEAPNRLTEGIEVSNLSFSYEGQKEALHDVSARFLPGKSYAIVGGSGSGKSTLLNLLMASYNTYSGHILYDGRELRLLSGDSVYDLVSMVQQNVFVFNASIRDNITMFSNFPREEVDRAIALSGLSQLIRQRGEDYLCGENGCGLSGGEKQRISIARSLLKKSQVLLVDEATASLDPQTAFQVSSAILDLRDMTRIVVTHSLEEGLLQRYDCILTLKNGNLVECGTFRELMEKKGYFYSLFTVSQQ